MSDHRPDVVDAFDAQLQGLRQSADLISPRRPSTVVVDSGLRATATYVVETFTDPSGGATVVVQRVDAAGGDRQIIPPAVIAAVLRQVEANAKRLDARRSEERSARQRARWDAMTDEERAASVAPLKRKGGR